MTRSILVTSALPYANGSLHLGHIYENFLVDFWVRFLKMKSHSVYFFCADDTHGTPVMLAAQRQGISPEKLVEKVRLEHLSDFKKFLIDHTAYGSTHTDSNKELCYFFYEAMKSKGVLSRKPMSQLYCEHDKMFLPDRFVKGTCPHCGALKQNGDACDVCGGTYSPKDVLNPECAVCSNAPVEKETDQIFFQLEKFREFLKEWVPNHTDSGVSQKMKDWLKESLRDWDISRNSPYFGFSIPGEENKFFYVWLDAPMGYVSTSKDYFDKEGLNWKSFWGSESQTEVYHFIGKDITYFHTLFWPAVLKNADLRLPTEIVVHGFVKVNGEKMSKSKGTFILAQDYLKALKPEYLRYYFATKAGPGQDDIDFNIEDFVSRTNGELIGKIINLFSRSWSMLKKFDHQLSKLTEKDKQSLFDTKKNIDKIESHYEKREFYLAMNEIRALADEANRFFDQAAPWKIISEDPESAHKILTLTLNKARQIAICLAPVLPNLTLHLSDLLNENSSYQWSDIFTPLESKEIKPYASLLNRIDLEEAKTVLSSHQRVLDSNTLVKQKEDKDLRENSLKKEIDFSIFDQVDLRVGKVIEAQLVKGADKLIQLKVDLGELGSRQIFAGLRKAYSDPSLLLGKQVVIVANLKPRAMKFGISEGMVIVAGSGGEELYIVTPEKVVQPGAPVK